MGKLTEGLGGGGGGDIPPGATRTINARDKQGNIVKTMILHRTNRPYVFDLRDTYNECRTLEALERGVEWYVNEAGDLRIGFRFKGSNAKLRELHYQQ